jgi:hypothetical protein
MTINKRLARTAHYKATIMNTYNNVLLSTCLLFVAQAGFACDYPSERVVIPNGSTVSKEDLLAAQVGVKSYLAALLTYRECIVEEEKLARLAMENLAPEVEQQREDLLNKKYNASVEDEERMAAEFNAAVQDYNKQKK